MRNFLNALRKYMTSSSLFSILFLLVLNVSDKAKVLSDIGQQTGEK